MTIGEYISSKFRAWNITEANMADFAVSSGLNPEDDYTADVSDALGKGMVSIIEELMLSPVLKNVSENGFSMSWDYSNMGRYYLWLCRKYGITPNDDVLDALGLSTIRDMTDIW